MALSRATLTAFGVPETPQESTSPFGTPDNSSVVSPGGTPTVPPTAMPTEPAQIASAPAPTYGSYTPTAGWDTTKLQDPNKHDPKYDWLRSEQAVGSNQDLQKVIDYYNSNYGQYDPQASLVAGSHDQVNFGADYGNIDVLGDQEGARFNWWNPVGSGGAGAGVPPPPSPLFKMLGGSRSFDPSQAIPNSGISGYGSFGGAQGQASPGLDGAGAGAGAGAGFDPAGGGGNVGQDPLSQAIMSALGGSLQSGSSPLGNQVAQQLMGIIGAGGTTPNMTQQLINARANAATMQQSMLSDADAALADRGLASTPGVPQGASAGAVERISQQIAPSFASALSDISQHGMDLSQESLLQSLSLATGLSEDQAHNVLGAINAGTNRQQVLANIALQSLSLNQDWNKFLLNYGLDQQQLAENISNGRIDEVAKLLDIFMRGGASTQQGYI